MSEEQQGQPAQPPAPAPQPAPSHNEMPSWAADMQRRMDELAGAVAKVPEQAVNAVREATQPARQPRQRSTTTKTTTTKTAEPEPKSESQGDTSQPGKSKGFAQWWFGE